MSAAPLRVVHALHDFLPRHQAGSEIYAFELARELSGRQHVFILAAEYDPATPHGTLRWRMHGGLTVIELVNNWEFDSLDESYGSPRINAQLRHALDAAQPDVLHVHNLLNLSFDLPQLARERGARIVATLHDYTLLCPSGGQRVHVDERHVCADIDPERCARCFPASAFYGQMRASNATRAFGRMAVALAARAPSAARRVAGRLPGPSVTAADIRRRLASARHVFDMIDWFVAPSSSIADEYVRFGLNPDRVEISDYGFAATTTRRRTDPGDTLRIGFVGTLVWHKGAHILLEAARGLTGNYEITLHGDTGTFPDYVRSLRDIAQGLPVRFAGRCDREGLPDVYGHLDVLVVPSLWPENSPLVIHEAFMHGVAVVGAAAGGISGLVRDGVDGILYPPFSAPALTGALQRLIDNRELVARLAAASPAVKTIDEDAREWEDRYSRVLQIPAAS